MSSKRIKNKKNLQKILNQAIQLHQTGSIQKAINLYLKILPHQVLDMQRVRQETVKEQNGVNVMW